MKGLSKEFMIGVLVVAIIAILVIGLNYLKGVNVFDRPQTYYAIYPNAGLLTESNPVLLSGVKVGLVKSVKLHPSGDSRVVVEITLNDNNLQVPLDSRLRIISADLFGTKAVMIEIGDSTVMARDRDTLRGKLEEDLLQSLKSEFEPLKDKTQKLISRVDEAVNNLNKMFNDTAMKGLPKIFAGIQETIDNLENTTRNLDGLIAENSPRFNSIMTSVESITTNLKNNNDKLSRSISNVTSLSDTLAKLQLASTLLKVDKAMGDFASIAQKINSGEGSLSRLLNNDSLHTELVGASHSLDLLLNDMRVHPHRYLSFSLIARREKSEFSKRELEQMRNEIDKALKEKEKAKDH